MLHIGKLMPNLYHQNELLAVSANEISRSRNLYKAKASFLVRQMFDVFSSSLDALHHKCALLQGGCLSCSLIKHFP